MKKFSLSLLTLMSAITCSAAENTFDTETFEIPSSGSGPIETNSIVTPKPSSFRKYVSIDVSSLAKLHARFNFGFRNEIGRNGCDLGIFGLSGRSTSACGGYASYLYYFNPESNFKFYSGAGLDAGLLWTKQTYGAMARGVIPIGLNHIAKSGRNDFFQINIFWPQTRYEKIYENKQDRYYFLKEDRPSKVDRYTSYFDYRRGRTSSTTRDLNNIGISVNYGLFF